MSLRLVVATEHRDTGIKVSMVPLKEGESIQDAAIGVTIDEWEWTPDDMEQYRQHLEYFILDPDLYKNVLNKIRWPEPWGPTEFNRYKAKEAIDRTKLAVYRACKISWTHASVQKFHRKDGENVFTYTG